MKAALVVCLLLALAGATAAGGYALGHSRAPNSADAGSARSVAARSAQATALASATVDGRRSGLQAGLTEGRRAGEAEGAKRGRAAGLAAARAELATIRAAKAAAQARAAEAAAQAKAAQAAAQAQQTASNAPATGGCNVPLFAPGSCPTPAEIQRENQAESLCGGGTAAGREEAAKLGIQC